MSTEPREDVSPCILKNYICGIYQAEGNPLHLSILDESSFLPQLCGPGPVHVLSQRRLRRLSRRRPRRPSVS